MRLNEIAPAFGATTKAKRVGRGIGSGSGKTAGRGHKGQKARSGGKVRAGFEGGQMPLQRRLPKSGFTSRQQQYVAEVRLRQLLDKKIDQSKTITLSVLFDSGLIRRDIKTVKIIFSNLCKETELSVPLNLQGLRVTKGARTAIENAGGKVE